MIVVRRGAERGHASHDWLESFHTFSFADYYDPSHMGFRSLRVINEDYVQPARGFAPHSHRDMEIVTYVLDGALQHPDSMGNGEIVRPGEVQRMTAGTGVTHSELNASQSELVHLLQIWILPDRPDLEPSYEQTAFPDTDHRNALVLAASRDGRRGSVTIHQDAELHLARLDTGRSVTHALGPGRGVWVHVARGAIELGGEKLSAGDAAAVTDARSLTLTAQERADVLLFDLA